MSTRSIGSLSTAPQYKYTYFVTIQMISAMKIGVATTIANMCTKWGQATSGATLSSRSSSSCLEVSGAHYAWSA